MYIKFYNGFQGPRVAERTRIHQKPFIKVCSNFELIIYSVPQDGTLTPNTVAPISRIIFLGCTSIFNFLLLLRIDCKKSHLDALDISRQFIFTNDSMRLNLWVYNVYKWSIGFLKQVIMASIKITEYSS